MGDKEESKIKPIIPILGAVLVAVLTSTGGMMYRHELSLIKHDREISQTRARLYRERVKALEFHERYMINSVQLIQLRNNKEGLGVVDKSILLFFENQRDLVQEEKENYIETWKHEGQ